MRLEVTRLTTTEIIVDLKGPRDRVPIDRNPTAIIRAAARRFGEPIAICGVEELRRIRDQVENHPDDAVLALQYLLTEFGGDPNP